MSQKDSIHGQVYIVGKSIFAHKNVWTASYETIEETHVIEFKESGGYFEGTIVKTHPFETEVLRCRMLRTGRLFQNLLGRFEWQLRENDVDIATVRTRGRTLELRLEHSA